MCVAPSSSIISHTIVPVWTLIVLEPPNPFMTLFDGLGLDSKSLMLSDDNLLSRDDKVCETKVKTEFVSNKMSIQNQEISSETCNIDHEKSCGSEMILTNSEFSPHNIDCSSTEDKGIFGDNIINDTSEGIDDESVVHVFKDTSEGIGDESVVQFNDVVTETTIRFEI